MKFLSLLFLFFSSVAGAQKIKLREFDDRKKQWRIESLPVNLKTAPDVKMDVALRAEGTAYTLQIAGSGKGTGTVRAGDQVIFLLENDSTVTVKSLSVQTADRTKTSGAYRHDYVLTLDDLETLSRYNLQGVRKYSADGYEDVFPDKASVAKLKELSSVFMDELKKDNVVSVSGTTLPPDFPGGKEVMLRFLNRNLKALPLPEATEKKTAVVKFRVTAEGDVSNLQITQSAGAAYDNELLRILKRMPKWKPAFENGKLVNAEVTHFVTFYRADSTVRVQL